MFRKFPNLFLIFIAMDLNLKQLRMLDSHKSIDKLGINKLL